MSRKFLPNAAIILCALVALTGAGQPARTRGSAQQELRGESPTDSGACAANSSARLLDFWVGDWQVSYPGTTHAGRSTVVLQLAKCLVVEHWTGGTGGEGRNVMAYNREDARWHGLYADNEGRVHVLEGTVTADSADFRGPSTGADGTVVLNRVRIVRVSADKVEQVWDKSRDGGATWTREFMGVYSRSHA